MSFLTRNITTDAKPGLVWGMALAFATIVGTFVTACMMPFVAVAVIAAATVPPRQAAVTVMIIWFINQLLGFTLLGFPWTSYTFASGAALGVSSLAAMAVARFVLARKDGIVAMRLAAAFVAAFVTYEALLFGFVAVAGGLDTFAPEIVRQIALNDALWFAGLLALHIALTRTAPRWFGQSPALHLA